MGTSSKVEPLVRPPPRLAALGICSDAAEEPEGRSRGPRESQNDGRDPSRRTISLPQSPSTSASRCGNVYSGIAAGAFLETVCCPAGLSSNGLFRRKLRG